MPSHYFSTLDFADLLLPLPSLSFHALETIPLRNSELLNGRGQLGAAPQGQLPSSALALKGSTNFFLNQCVMMKLKGHIPTAVQETLAWLLG